jgi:hypothetical protein
MDKIGPVEAANTIRDEFLNEHIDPRFHHQVRFSGDVLAELGQEKSIENTAKVMRLLTKHGIEGHAYDDYPKWVTNERGERAVVNDEDHEASFMSRPESHVDGNPNPEHGHVDPQSGVFHAGMKPVVYDHSEFDAMEPHIHGAEQADIDADRHRVEGMQNTEFVAAQDRGAIDRRLAETEIHDNLQTADTAHGTHNLAVDQGNQLTDAQERARLKIEGQQSYFGQVDAANQYAGQGRPGQFAGQAAVGQVANQGTGQVNDQGQQASRGVKPDPVQNRAEQIRTEQVRLEAAEKAEKDERDRMAELQK